MTIKEFVKSEGIGAVVTQTLKNPNMEESKYITRHFNVKLRSNRRDTSMTVPFSQGSAYTKNPTAEDVLDCLASDSSGIDNTRDFEDWCSDYGYDTDSRRAEQIYIQCQNQAAALKAFLGADAFKKLLFEVERL